MKKLLLLLACFTSYSFAQNQTQKPVDIANKNIEYLKNTHIEMECSKGLNSVNLVLFNSKQNLYLYRDSNSNMGTQIAAYELDGTAVTELIEDRGLIFQQYSVNRVNDFYISSETLKKGKGKITAIIYNEFYSCDVEVTH